MNNSKRLLALAVSAAIAAPMSAYATNGMNLEGYGPIATGMGGASMAYDNGTAAVMNNPATLGLMDEGNRIDVAWGFLGPNVDASYDDGMLSGNWSSDANAFNMPAFGWAQKKSKLTYGVGMFAQGGMGTEFKPTATKPTPGTAFVFAPNPPYTFGGNLSQASVIAADVMGWDEFSEVGVMRIIAPLSYNVNDKLTVGGSIDYVRASMDIKMAMAGGMMMDMMPTAYNPAATQTYGTLSGTMIDGMATQMGLGNITGVYGGYFDFADDNPYTGETTGSGFAGKLGVTYEISEQLSVGATYHSKTNLGDLSGDATVSMAVATPGGDMVMPLSGKIKVKDFQWPTTMGVGVSYKPTGKWQVAADVKRINWSDVMEDFHMVFTADGSASNGGFANTSMDAVLFQEWKDQTVLQLGVAYNATSALVVRAGMNKSDNPIPDDYLNYLFPATIKDHYTVGFGYSFNQASDLNFSYTYAPEVSEKASNGIEIDHSQSNWQMMYSHSF